MASLPLSTPALLEHDPCSDMARHRAPLASATHTLHNSKQHPPYTAASSTHPVVASSTHPTQQQATPTLYSSKQRPPYTAASNAHPTQQQATPTLHSSKQRPPYTAASNAHPTQQQAHACHSPARSSRARHSSAPWAGAMPGSVQDLASAMTGKGLRKGVLLTAGTLTAGTLTTGTLTAATQTRPMK